MNSDKPIKLKIDGTLDLHSFRPEDLSTLIDEYIDACLKKKIYELRIIHGKGIGNIRRSVHSLLDRNPYVDHYQLAGPGGGSWGATVVNLKK